MGNKQLSSTTFDDIIKQISTSNLQDNDGAQDYFADGTEIKKHIKDITDTLDSHNYDLAVHKWLAGFDSVINGRSFDESLINIYVDAELKKHPSFTTLVSSSLIIYYKKMIDSGKIQFIHLPVDDSYNLSFSIFKKNYSWNILYIDCSDDCRVLAPYRFPAIQINMSLDLSRNKEIDGMNSGYMFCDPSVSLYHVKDLENTLRKTYAAMQGFADYCALKK